LRVLSPEAAWRRLALLQQALDDAPALALAVRRLPLREQLTMTIELLRDAEGCDAGQDEPLPSNVLRFRPR
jgi:hypothetical protein